MTKINVGIVGYGNLGRGVELAIEQNSDMNLVAIFTRRDPKTLTNANDKMVSINDIESYKGKIDVMLLCGGSATDLEVQGPEIAKMFNTVDSFDTHAKIPTFFDTMNTVAKGAGTLSAISVGWDPGVFSLIRVLSNAILPQATDYTFWGKGVSQGHSDAIRRVKGVKDGKQYTVPKEEALAAVRTGNNPELTTREKHLRVCYIVAEEGADKDAIVKEIVEMPNYFSDYDTEVNFISEEELKANHAGLPHGGFVVRTGTTGADTKQKVEFSLELGSNPEFTGSVLIAYARAVYRMSQEGQTGALTVFDVPFAKLTAGTNEDLRKHML